MFAPVAKAIRDTHTQLRMVTPYLIPTASELKLLQEAAGVQGRQVRILTTSLEASTDPLAQAGYRHYREPLLSAGVELFELRRQPDSPRGTGQSTQMTRYGNFGLHAKLLVFDDSGRLYRLDELRRPLPPAEHRDRSHHLQPGARRPRPRGASRR